MILLNQRHHLNTNSCLLGFRPHQAFRNTKCLLKQRVNHIYWSRQKWVKKVQRLDFFIFIQLSHQFTKNLVRGVRWTFTLTKKTPANRVCYSSFFSTILSVKISPTPTLLASLFLLHTSPTLAEVLTFANDTTRQSNLSAGVLKFDTNGHFITSELPHQTNNTATVSPSVWKAQSDEYLTDVIKRWGKEAGYTVIATGTGAWQLKVPLTKVGSFEEALEHVIKGFSSQGHPPSVRVFSNKVIKIGSAL